MPTFLWFYVAGLTGALAVGFAFYYLLGAYCGPMLEKLFGQRGATLWGRSFRMFVVISALVGGLSTQWYGCHGYTDYKKVETNRRIMVQKSTEQVASAISSASGFVVLAAGISAIAYALLWRGRGPAGTILPPPSKPDTSPDRSTREAKP